MVVTGDMIAEKFNLEKVDLATDIIFSFIHEITYVFHAQIGLNFWWDLTEIFHRILY